MFASIAKRPTPIGGSWPKLRRAHEAAFLEADIEIAAPPRRVWAILCDFPAYPAWNPFLTAIAGRLRRGEVLAITMAGAEAPVTLRARLRTVRRRHELAWTGEFLAPGLFDVVHRIRLEPVGRTGTLVRQEDRFSGVFAPLFGTGPVESARAGFEAMNQALKKRAESA